MWDKIARTGTFKALNGKDYTFTRDKFEMIAKNYKGATEKAPIVLGHPSTDDPALGWVKELRVNGDYLEASYEDVSPELKSDVELGRYRYKSMALYPDLQRLKHIGFLGAVLKTILIVLKWLAKKLSLYFPLFYLAPLYNSIKLKSF